MGNITQSGYSTYIPALDGLRGVSILAVMGFHGEWKYFGGGGWGVDLFFVISGYLITWLLLKEKDSNGSVNLRNFYLRRILRIMPAFYVFLTGYYILCLIIFTDFKPVLIDTMIIASVYATNIMTGWFNHPVLLDHTWSLALEEQFYLLFPAVVAFTTKRTATVLVSMSVLIVPLWRTILMITIGMSGSLHRYTYSPDTRIDTILWGCLLALLLHQNVFKEHLIKFAEKGFLLLLGSIFLISTYIISKESAYYLNTVGYTFRAIGFTSILLYCLTKQKGVVTLLSAKPMRAIGRLSYSLYLWHPAMLGVSGRIANHVDEPSKKVVYAIVYIIMTFFCSVFSYYVIEKPFLNLKKRYYSLRSQH